MLDYDAIAARIREERKFSKGISQEAMAADLNMYQADISNLERARKGSGIADLNRLDRIAGYFGMPLEELIFGRKDSATMFRYGGDATQIRLLSGDEILQKEESEILTRIFGTEASSLPVHGFVCGPYRLFFIDEVLRMHPETFWDEVDFVHRHSYVFFEGRIVATLRLTELNIFAAMNQILARCAQRMIPFKVFDFGDIARRVNPYVALQYFSGDEKGSDAYQEEFVERLEKLRPINADPIGVIVSVYVRKDCRRRGLCRMMIDAANVLLGEKASFWLNLQPTSDDDLEGEKKRFPEQTPLTPGVMTLNAHIAERLGFTIEADCWNLPVVVRGADGSEEEKIMPLRKIAYRLSAPLTAVLADDGDLVEVGRAMQRAAFFNGTHASNPIVSDEEVLQSRRPTVPVVELLMSESMQIHCPICGATVLSDVSTACCSAHATPCEHTLFIGSHNGIEYQHPDSDAFFPDVRAQNLHGAAAVRALTQAVQRSRAEAGVCFVCRHPQRPNSVLIAGFGLTRETTEHPTQE